VVVVSPTAAFGGAERSLIELVRRVPASVRFTIVVPAPGPFAEQARAAGAAVEIVRWPTRLLGLGERARGVPSVRSLVGAAVVLPSFVWRMRWRLAALAPTLVLSNGIKAHVLAALAHLPGVPVVWYGREGLEGRPVGSWVLRAVGRRCQACIAISSYVASEMRRVLPRDVPIAVVPNLVDLEVHRPGLALPEDLAREEGSIWFGVVGALTPLKGQDLFLDAAAEVARHLPGARFVLVGGVPYDTEADFGFEPRLRAQVARLGLGDRVLLLGERQDAARLIANLDVLVQPNRGPEGLGRAILEAMASAVAVVAVDRWGPAELVRDGETGVLVPVGDVHALAAAMLRLGTDPALRARLGGAGRHWVTEAFDQRRILARFAAALSTVPRNLPIDRPDPTAVVPCARSSKT
jgi:glycosyltransferase involved in cell wall biosynthesis